MSYITAIGTANPPHRFSQSKIAEFMLRAMKLNNGDARKLRTVFRASGIDFRHSVIEDYGRSQDFTFYPDTKDLEPFPTTQKRLEVFRSHAAELSISAVHNMIERYGMKVSDVTHLIVVCCTGMYAPGLDIDLVRALGLSSNVQRTAINFMGCHAAFNAIRIADAWCNSKADAKVLIVCTELCSLHFQRPATDDNILANALFADGSAALLMDNRGDGALRLRINQFDSVLATEGVDDMAWTIGDLGFEMRLSAYVPDLIRKGIRTMMLTKSESVKTSDIGYFAIHPGGRRILEVMEEELGITREQNRFSYEVLRNYGNMSSPTVLFVLKGIVDHLNGNGHGEHVLAAAFGPGLTLETMILKNETRHAYA